MTQPSSETDSITSSQKTQTSVEAGHEQEKRIVLQGTNDRRLEPSETNDYDGSDSESSEFFEDGGNGIALPTPDFSGGITATVQNSSGVTIAQNLNHINGPVTIIYPSNYRNGVNGIPGITDRERNAGATVNSEASRTDTKIGATATNKDEGKSTTVPKKYIFSKKHKKFFICTSVVLLLVITVTVALSILLPTTHNDSTTVTPPPSTITTTTVTPDDDGIQVISKSRWGGREALNKTYVESGSVFLAVVKHTGGTYCNDFKECASTLQALQSYHVGSEHSPDIWFNFLIGGDGNIYEGRGWNVQNEGRKDTVDICYMGNFTVDIPTPKMIEAGKKVVTNGIVYGYIFVNYNVVNHNQTENTTSPGENIYREVMRWPNYYSNEIPSNCVVNGSKILC